jgi:hypothetical protein
MAGKSKIQAVKFDKTNKSQIKNASTRTRSGASTGPNRRRAHGKHYKH